MSQEPKQEWRRGALRLSAVGTVVGAAGLVASLWFGAAPGMLVALAALGSFAGLVGLGRLSAAIATADVRVGACLLVAAVILGSLLTLGPGAPGALSTLAAMWTVQGAAWLAALATLFVAAAAAGRAPQAVGALSAALGLGVLGVWAQRAQLSDANFAWPLSAGGEPLMWGIPSVRQASALQLDVVMGADSVAALVATAVVVAGLAALASSELLPARHRLRTLADKLWASAALAFGAASAMIFASPVGAGGRLVDETRLNQAREWLSSQQMPAALAEQGGVLADLSATPAVVDLGQMSAEFVALLMCTLLCGWAAWQARRVVSLQDVGAEQVALSRGLVGRSVALMTLAWAWGQLVTWESTGAFGMFTRAEWAGLAAPLLVLGLHQASFDEGALGAQARRFTPWVALAFVSAMLLWVWSHGAAPGVGASPF